MNNINGNIHQVLVCTVANIDRYENVSYQWLRNGEPIDGATEDTYELTFDDYLIPDRGITKDITCRVSADVDAPEFKAN
jgi:hypothetical protein